MVLPSSTTKLSAVPAGNSKDPSRSSKRILLPWFLTGDVHLHKIFYRVIKYNIFTQYGNLPLHEDGIGLFKQLTTFTTVAFLQPSMLSFTSILNFNPIDFKLISLWLISNSFTYFFSQPPHLASSYRRSAFNIHWMFMAKSFNRKRRHSGLEQR